MSSKQDQATHDYLVKQAYNQPRKLGFDESLIIAKAMEYEMYFDGILYVKPDIYIKTREMDYYYEIKGRNSSKTRQKGAYWFVISYDVSSSVFVCYKCHLVIPRDLFFKQNS